MRRDFNTADRLLPTELMEQRTTVAYFLAVRSGIKILCNLILV